MTRATLLAKVVAACGVPITRRANLTGLTGAMTLLRYQQIRGGERVAALPIHAGDASGQAYQTVLSLPLELAAGQLVQARAECEVTNTNPYLTMVASSVVLTRSADATEGITLASPLAEDAQPQCHYVAARSGSAVVPASGRWFVNLLVRGGSDWSRPGDVIRVERNYGTVGVEVFG